MRGSFGATNLKPVNEENWQYSQSHGVLCLPRIILNAFVLAGGLEEHTEKVIITDVVIKWIGFNLDS